MSHVFPRVLNRVLATAVRAEGCWIEDADGKRYLDGGGGAIVVNVGHGDRDLIRAMTEQAFQSCDVEASLAHEAVCESVPQWMRRETFLE